MTLQNIVPNPSQKLFEAYMDFSGGLNSQVGNEMLKDNEYPVLENVDLSSRGTAKRRTGHTLVASVAGNGQGLWYYNRKGQSEPDIVFAVSGQLYYIPNGSTNPIQIPIVDPTNSYATLTFQTTQAVNAVQYKTTLYIATGTKLCMFGYDSSPNWAANTAYAVGQTVNLNGHIYKCTVAGNSGTTGPTGTSYTTTVTDGGVTWQYIWDTWYAQVVNPYQPNSMEAVYIGLNGLAANPTTYITDSSGPVLQVNGIQPAQPFGVVNQAVNLTALIQKPSTITSVKYEWSYRVTVDAGQTENAWTAGLTGTDSAGKSFAFTPNSAMKYDIQVVITDNTAGAQTPLATYTYVLSAFQVYATSSSAPHNTSLPVTGIQTCRNIILHWDRLIMWGDGTTPWQMYVSDLMAPSYFPMTNTILFDNGKQEPITSVLEWRGNIVVFTTTTCQILTGKSPDTYVREILYGTMGCIAERCAGVTGNTITFLSAEGVHSLKPNPYMIDVMDLNRIDWQIKDELVKDTNARGLVYDSQFWLCIPSKNYVYRYYYEQGNVWVRDTSSKLHFVDMIHYGNVVHSLSSDGNIYVLDSTSYTDGGEAYTMTVTSKFFDLGSSFDWKKIKRVFFLARHFMSDVNLQVTVWADSAMALTPTVGQASIVQNPDGTSSASFNWTTTPNFKFFAGTSAGVWLLGDSPLGDTQISVENTHIRGKARRVKVSFVHVDASPCEVFGFGVEFKLKKPY